MAEIFAHILRRGVREDVLFSPVLALGSDGKDRWVSMRCRVLRKGDCAPRNAYVGLWQASDQSAEG
eukprot:602846-Karenia_brevis.AAC.1